MSSTSIDDLLSSSTEGTARTERQRGGRVRGVLRALAVTAATVVVVLAGLRAVGLRVSLVVLIAAVLAVLTVRRVAAGLAPPPPSPVGTRTFTGDGPPPRDAVSTAINGWEVPLDWSATRPERFAQVILPRLGDLADERLRLRHGVTRDSDPVRARALLGELLWIFLESPPRRTPSPRDLATIVAELEKI